MGDQVTQLAELAGHEGPVWAVAWSHPAHGPLLASASFDHRVCVWKEAAPGAWQPVYSEPLHTASVNAVAFAPHELGLALAAAGSDGAVSVLTHSPERGWGADRIEWAHTAGALGVAWAPAAPAGALTAAAAPVAPERRLATCGCDNLVKVREGDGFWVGGGVRG